MSFSIEFHAAIADEINQLKLHHENSRSGFGEKFYAALLAEFELITSNPHVYAIAESDVRIARVKGFSYLVRYRILGKRVRVVSIVHSARAKGRWRFRR